MNLIALTVIGGIILLVIILMVAFAVVRFCRKIEEWKAIDQDNDKILIKGFGQRIKADDIWH
jgi:hypothetical protein